MEKAMKTHDPASAKRKRKQALTMRRTEEDYESELRVEPEDTEPRDPAKLKRDRKNALTPKTAATEAGEVADGEVRGRGRTEETVQQPYDPAGVKKRRKQLLTPSTLDPAN
jgi:hypothetical protein